MLLGAGRKHPRAQNGVERVRNPIQGSTQKKRLVGMVYNWIT
jgi:hypothetical protein